MNILILGSGGVGGYFGARLIEVGVEITFFVKKKRATLIKNNGIYIESPHGNLHVPANTLSVGDAKQKFDLVILTCKAYDLESSLDDLTKVLSEIPIFLPLLNGISHIEYLRNRFGNNKVLGGAAHIASILTSKNIVKQLNPIQILTIGSIGTDLETIALEFKKICEEANFKTIYTKDILQALWDKWTFLATLAGSTTLFSACVGDITSIKVGANLMKKMYKEALSVAEIENHKVDIKAQKKALEILMKPSSDFTSSMLRDLQSKKRTEHEHILGDLVRIGVQKKLDLPLLTSAYVNISIATQGQNMAMDIK